MTPLAQRLTRDLIKPKAVRTMGHLAKVSARLADAHCFEVTDVMELAEDLRLAQLLNGTDERTTFLPAARTWIEFSAHAVGDFPKYRAGFLLEDQGDRTVNVTQIGATDDSVGEIRNFAMPLALDGAPRDQKLRLRWLDEPENDQLISARLVRAFLALINTPRIIGRRQHMPHRGLEKALRDSQHVVGTFPLNAWTEIRLECRAPVDLSNTSSAEAHYTGRKCLHFCRAHLRICAGKVVFVSSSWKGDPALGIKRSRYNLRPGPHEQLGAPL
jgi:hypothetical protein